MTAETKEKPEGLISFLRTDISQDDLATALRVILAFKDCESQDDWLQPFHMWVRLEQLEDYLKLLTGTGTEAVEDQKAIDFLKAVRL